MHANADAADWGSSANHCAQKCLGSNQTGLWILSVSWFVCWIHINNVVTWLHKGFLETCAVTLFVGPVSVSFHSHRILLIYVGAFSPCDGFLSQHALLFTRPGWSASWPSSLFQDLALGMFWSTLIKWSNTLIFRHSLHVAGWTNFALWTPSGLHSLVSATCWEHSWGFGENLRNVQIPENIWT